MTESVSPGEGEVAEIPRPKSQIEFYLDARGQKRWRVQLAGNHEIIGAATEGYHNLPEAAENLVQLVQEVAKETLAGRYEQRHIDDFLTEVREGVMRIAARGIPQDEKDRFIAGLRGQVANKSINPNVALPSVPPNLDV